jgi:hypothetical protein
MGRPTEYIQEYDIQAYKLCLLGATDVQLADFFEVSEQTVNSWKQKFPSFLESLKKGKIQADAEIAEALFHRAKGYSHTAVKFFQNRSEIISKEYIEHYPPDTGAAFIWLKNRAGWKDQVDHKHKIDVTIHEVLKSGDNRIEQYLGKS